MDYAIKLKNISKNFDDPNEKRVLALKDINMDIVPGEFFVFVGPSGSGKSTLLRVMSGLEKNYRGGIEFGQGFSRSDRNDGSHPFNWFARTKRNTFHSSSLPIISFVFQQFALLPWLTVFENVELGLIARGMDLKKRTPKVMEELRLLGLEKFTKSYPRELSGGQRQRVGIARALATDPKIMFMDEPFSELDSYTAEELRGEILKIWRERKLTVVMVTHIVDDAIEMADRIAIFTPQPGEIKKIIQNDLPRPRQKRSQEFYNLEDNLYKLIKP